jgi:hypothetical protein
MLSSTDCLSTNVYLGTGVFQPADVGLQHLIKHCLCQESMSFLVAQHTEQMAKGLTPDQIKFTMSYPELRAASVGAIERVYDWLSSDEGHKIICQAWSKCTAQECNLSQQFLTNTDGKSKPKM